MNLVCDICRKPFKYYRRRAHCPDCAEGLKLQYKQRWRLRHPDYNREYLRKWKRELKEHEQSFNQTKAA